MHFITFLPLKRCSRAFYHLLSITETSKRALLLLLSGMAEPRNRLRDPHPFLSLLHCFITDNCKPCCINNYLNRSGFLSFVLQSKYAHSPRNINDSAIHMENLRVCSDSLLLLGLRVNAPSKNQHSKFWYCIFTFDQCKIWLAAAADPGVSRGGLCSGLSPTECVYCGTKGDLSTDLTPVTT